MKPQNKKKPTPIQPNNFEQTVLSQHFSKMADEDNGGDRFAISDVHNKSAARPKLFTEEDMSSFILPQRSASTGRTPKKTPRATTSPPV